MITPNGTGPPGPDMRHPGYVPGRREMSIFRADDRHYPGDIQLSSAEELAAWPTCSRHITSREEGDMSLVRRQPRILHEQEIVEIQLTKGKVAIIDICDAERVCQYNWYASVGRGACYARTDRFKDDGTRTTIWLHRFILESPPHMEVDHIDGDGLNNRRNNLRLATRALDEAAKGRMGAAQLRRDRILR